MYLPTEDPRTDSQLVAALNGGDPAAFDVLYYRYRDWVARLAKRLTGNDSDALDVLQETFAYLFRKFPGFRLSAKMTTFLYPVVRNLSIGIRKKRRRERPEDEIRQPPVAPAESSAPAEREGLAQILQNLPEPQREVLLMRFADGMSLQEIAEALSIPEGTVKSRLHNAIQVLKSDERIQGYFNTE